ncbi:10574_t:CDS:1, partial [Acaulospora colombiana]
MSTTPPPVPPKPNSQGRSNNEGGINQLLNLIDSEIPHSNWGTLSNNQQYSSSSQYPSSSPSNSYNANTFSQSYAYNSGPSYGSAQNYGGQPYYQENQYSNSQYPAYSPGWPAQTSNYSENYGPSSSQSGSAMPTPYSYVSEGTSYSIPTSHTGPKTTPVGYATPQLVMPDFHTYVNNSSGHQNDSNSLPRNSQ